MDKIDEIKIRVDIIGKKIDIKLYAPAVQSPLI